MKDNNFSFIALFFVAGLLGGSIIIGKIDFLLATILPPTSVKIFHDAMFLGMGWILSTSLVLKGKKKKSKNTEANEVRPCDAPERRKISPSFEAKGTPLTHA